MIYSTISNLTRRNLRIRSSLLVNNVINMQSALFSVEIKPLLLPALSPTMTHGSIATWHKKPGDSLAPGDILCDIETDKASVGFEFQDDGVLAKILIEAKGILFHLFMFIFLGEEIKIGSPIAFVVNDAKDYKAFLELPPSEYPKVGDSSNKTIDTTPQKAAESTSSGKLYFGLPVLS